MIRQDNHYYIAYAYEGDSPVDMDYAGGVRNDFTDYETALKYALEDHKAELDFQREENGRNSKDEVFNTYVMKTDPKFQDYPVAAIIGWRCKIKEFIYEE